MPTIDEMARYYERDAYADELQTQLEGYRVTLDPDPLEYGPGRLNEKVADARNAKEACNHLLGNFHQVLAHFQTRRNATEALFKMERADRLANDPVVRTGRSTSDREALAVLALRSRFDEMEELKRRVFHMECLIGILKIKIADLGDASTRLQEQIRLCHAQLSTGARWGRRVYSAPVPGAPEKVLEASSPEGPTMDDVLDLADGLSKRELASKAKFNDALEALPTLEG